MSKEGKELDQAAGEAFAHARGRIKLKEFHADMSEEERERLLKEICTADPYETTEAESIEDGNDRKSSRSRLNILRSSHSSSTRSGGSQ